MQSRIHVGLNNYYLALLTDINNCKKRVFLKCFFIIVISAVFQWLKEHWNVTKQLSLCCHLFSIVHDHQLAHRCRCLYPVQEYFTMSTSPWWVYIVLYFQLYSAIGPDMTRRHPARHKHKPENCATDKICFQNLQNGPCPKLFYIIGVYIKSTG